MFRYLPKIPTSLCFLISLVGAFILFMGRKKDFLRMDSLLELFPDFYQHVSNFSLSYIILASVGYMALLRGTRFLYIAAIGVVFLLLTVAYELWIPLLNTPDLFDAYYGIAGVLAAFLFLVPVHFFGLLINPQEAH